MPFLFHFRFWHKADIGTYLMCDAGNSPNPRKSQYHCSPAVGPWQRERSWSGGNFLEAFVAALPHGRLAPTRSQEASHGVSESLARMRWSGKSWMAALIARLRGLGWSVGENIAIEYRWAEGRS